MKMRQGQIYVEIVEYPLKDVQSVEDLKEKLVLPDLSSPDVSMMPPLW